MKHHIFLIIFTLFIQFTVYAQSSCLSEGLTITSQGDINNFVNQYPDCTHIIGKLFAFTPAQTLDGLQQIESIGGDLGICCTAWPFKNLEGLNNLKSVGGYVHITGHKGLQDISALSQLTTIGGELKIFNNLILENLDGLESLESVGGYLDIQWNDNIKDISALRNLSHVGGSIEVDGNDVLQTLGGFMSDIDYLEKSLSITNNPLLTELTGIESLDSVGGYLSIRGNAMLNKISTLTDLQVVGGGLTIQDNPSLTSLEGLENLREVRANLTIQNNDTLATASGLQNLSYVRNYLRISGNEQLKSFAAMDKLIEVEGDLFIYDNPSLEHFDGLRGLHTVGGRLGIYDNDTLLHLDELSNLRYVLGTLRITDDRNLSSITGLQNINPTFLNYKSTSTTSLTLTGNPQLSDCQIQPICDLVERAPGKIRIESNGPTCDEADDFMCGRYSIRGKVFLDKNKDGIYGLSEYGVNGQQIELSGTDYNVLTDEFGNFSIICDSAEMYSLSLLETPYHTLTTDSQYVFTFVPGDTLNDDFVFGIYPTEEEYTGQVSLSSEPTRCNTDVTFYIRIRNTSFALIRGRVDLLMDPSTTFVSASEPLIGEFSNTTRIALETDFLSPYEYQDIQIVLQMPTEQSTGQALSFSTDFYRAISSDYQLLDHQDYDEIVLCSYDPNDKKVSPAGVKEENYTLADQALTYTVRFQNTGNAEAIDVRIRDTISPFLDMTTLEVLDASFQHHVLVRERAVEFFFENIYLPDSVSNEPLSHGYVTYRINPLPGIEDLSVIENTAHIIFDFNPAIVTNTTSNTMVDTIGETVYVEIDTVACAGDVILGLTSNGTLSDTIDNGPLCLLIHNTHVYFQAASLHVESYSGCTGDSISVRGEQIYVGGEILTYTDSTYTSIGCLDSLIDITVAPIILPPITIDTSICEGLDYMGFVDAGTYNLDSLDQLTGCIQEIVLELGVIPASDPTCITSTVDIDFWDFRIFPNPSSAVVTVTSNQHLDSVVLYDMRGQRIRTIVDVGSECTIDVSNLSAGVYLMVCSTGSSFRYERMIRH